MSDERAVPQGRPYFTPPLVPVGERYTPNNGEGGETTTRRTRSTGDLSSIGRNPQSLDARQRAALLFGDNIWAVTIGIALLGVLSLVVGIKLMSLLFLGIGICLTGFAGLIIVEGLVKIPADPPTMGQVTAWGKRIDQTIREFDPSKHVKSEGWVLLAPYFPLFYGVLLTEVTRRNEDFTYANVRCRLGTDEEEAKGVKRGVVRKKINNAGKEEEESELSPQSGGEIRVAFGITWEPDPNRLSAFVNYGRDEGVQTTLYDVLGEDVRQAGAVLTWEEFSFATDALAVRFIEEITGISPNEEQARDPQAFLREVLSNGVGDVHDMGIILRRINVKPIEPIGELARAAELAAKERQERRGEDFETETEVRQALILQRAVERAGRNMSITEALLEVRQRKAIREGRGQVIEIPGLAQAAGAFAAAFSGVRQQNQPRQQTPQQRRPHRRGNSIKGGT